MSGDRFQLVLVRHGVTDWNETGRLIGRSAIALNPRGRVQAEAAAEALRSRPVAAVLSSPQLRARETAEPIARAHGLEVEVEPLFDEVWVTETWLGKMPQDLADDLEFTRFVRDPSYRSPAIEPTDEVARRVVAGVERLRTERPGQTVVIASHGDPLRAAVAHYLGIPVGRLRSLRIDNGSVSVLRFNAKGPQLTLLNWRASPA